MNRRNFIKSGSIFLALPVIMPMTGNLNNFLTSKSAFKSFSLNLLADSEWNVLPELQKFINSVGLEKNIVKYSEYSLSGTYKSDLTYIESNKLIDYKTSKSGLSSKLMELHDKLIISSELKDPVLIKMYNYNYNKAKELYVYSGDAILQKIELTDEERHYTVNSDTGKLTIESKNYKAKVIESSCTHKTCTKMKTAQYSGDSITCIPNRINIIAI